ncbi:hypothetical protein CY652_10595 [Burkholderia sp. WAC0059]|nr:hypothetical protein CY652_10595 [Burkholderia sp. WAC0059]
MARLGSALPRRRSANASRGARGFAEFEGFCTGRFQSGTQFFKSAMFTNFITPAGRTRFYHPPFRAAEVCRPCVIQPSYRLPIIWTVNVYISAEDARQ